jgi:hypothetical protein
MNSAKDVNETTEQSSRHRLSRIRTSPLDRERCLIGLSALPVRSEEPSQMAYDIAYSGGLQRATLPSSSGRTREHLPWRRAETPTL